MTTWEWPPWLRWTVRIAALIVIALGAVILYIAAPVNSAGNAGIEFIIDLGDDPDDLNRAFDRLCVSEQDRIGIERFLETDGAEYTVLADAGAVGAAAQYSDDAETLNAGVRQAWKEYEISTVNGQETWRLQLVRERDWWEINSDWKICGIAQRE